MKPRQGENSVDRARRLVEQLAETVVLPEPPADLLPGGTGPAVSRSRLIWLLPAGLIAAVALALVFAPRSLRSIPAAGGDQRIVLEHMRVFGQPVMPRILDASGTGAVLVMAMEPAGARGPGATEPGRPTVKESD